MQADSSGSFECVFGLTNELLKEHILDASKTSFQVQPATQEHIVTLSTTTARHLLIASTNSYV